MQNTTTSPDPLASSAKILFEKLTLLNHLRFIGNKIKLRNIPYEQINLPIIAFHMIPYQLYNNQKESIPKIFLKL